MPHHWTAPVDRPVLGLVGKVTPVQLRNDVVPFRDGEHNASAVGNGERPFVGATIDSGIGTVRGVTNRCIRRRTDLHHPLVAVRVLPRPERDAVPPLFRLPGIVLALRVHRKERDAQRLRFVLPTLKRLGSRGRGSADFRIEQIGVDR